MLPESNPKKSCRGSHHALRLHRNLLQSQAPPLSARLTHPTRVRKTLEQSNKPTKLNNCLSAFSKTDHFAIDIAKRTARCPGEYESTQCSRLEEANRQKVSFRFEWSYHCRCCPLRSEPVPAGQSHRTIVVGQYHDLLQQRLRDQRTEQFKERMQQRNAIEGTISDLPRAHGLRRTRYRGCAQVALQNLFIGTACNVKRWFRIVPET